MDSSLKVTFQFLEDITDLRYEVEQNFLDKLHTRMRSNNSIDPLVKGGFDFVNTALEGRYSLERNVIKRMKTEAEKKASENDNPLEEEPTDGSNTPTGQQQHINAGTILIKATPSQKKVGIPLNLNNSFDLVQEATVEVLPLKNMKTGEALPDKIKIDADTLSIPPKESMKLNVTIDLTKDLSPLNQYFTTLTIKGKEHRVFQIIIEMLSGKDKKEKPSITLLPAQN